MKVSPVAQGTGVPAQSLDTAGITVDRKAAAKAAFLGQAQVTESDTPVDPQVARAQANIRKIRMKTNVSPDRVEAPLEEVPENTTNVVEPAADLNGIPDDSSDAAPVTEETKPLSPQFAALARQKRALQLEREKFQADKLAFEQTKGQTTGGYTKEQLKANPLGILLNDIGITYEQLTEAVLQNPEGNNSEIQALREELKATKDEFSKTLTERDTQTRREALAEIRRNTERLVATGDDFEMIRETGSQADVVDLIDRIHKTEGIVLDEAEAAVLVEEELLKEAEKIARIKKLQSRLTPAESQPVQQPQQPLRPQQMRTLTNRDNARASLSRRERALAAFRGELK